MSSSLKHLPFDEKPSRFDRRRLQQTKSIIWIVCLILVVLLIAPSKWFSLSDQLMRFVTGSVKEHQYSQPMIGTKSTGTYDVHDFNWSSIVPSENLAWVSCYSDYTCTRLQVPLDYKEPTSGKAAIALIKYPSKLSPTDEGYRGPVLFNPGGPGGSGVQLVLARAENFKSIIGEEYDILGFDPRGVGFTTPGLFAFLSKGEAGMAYINAFPTVNSSAHAIEKLYGSAKVVGELVKSRVKDVAEHVSTPTVARDMLSIVKAHGMDKLQYWGFSYGTVLGATFAAMFPNNVGRIVIDGVVDSENYYAGLWSNNLRDTDAVLYNLYQACVDAGPLACPVFEGNAEKIHSRIESAISKLRSHPISFFNKTSGAYGEVDYSVAKHAIFVVLYRTHELGSRLLSALADLENGIVEPIYQLSLRSSYHDMISATCDCPVSPATPFADGLENTLAIACGDGDQVHEDAEGLRKFYDTMAQDSIFAENWLIHTGCSGWKVRAKERFTASFESNTSFPLLLVGNTADPVTPLWNAYKMSKGFVNSVVLTQDSPGHCSLSAASLCTTKAIRAYFQNGTLPESGTVCEVESSIFKEYLDININMPSTEDQKLMEASRELQKNYFVPTL